MCDMVQSDGSICKSAVFFYILILSLTNVIGFELTTRPWVRGVPNTFSAPVMRSMHGIYRSYKQCLVICEHG